MFSESYNAASLQRNRGVSAETEELIKIRFRPSVSSIEEARSKLIFHRKGKISFVNHVKYFGVIFDKNITLRLHIKLTEPKVFRECIRAC
jgi:hypothetical protein